MIILNSLGAASMALAIICSLMLSNTYDQSLISSSEETNLMDNTMLTHAQGASSNSKSGPSPGTIFLSGPYAHFSR